MLGKGINKRTQLSDWSRRPLSGKQLHYAALDAHCELAILGRCLQELYARSNTPVDASLLPLIALADEYAAQGTSESLDDEEAEGATEELIKADKTASELPAPLPILSGGGASSPDTGASTKVRPVRGKKRAKSSEGPHELATAPGQWLHYFVSKS